MKIWDKFLFIPQFPGELQWANCFVSTSFPDSIEWGFRGGDWNINFQLLHGSFVFSCRVTVNSKYDDYQAQRYGNPSGEIIFTELIKL